MFDFHTDKRRYFDIQREVTGKYIIPFFGDLLPIGKPLRVLEVGCGEAGVLKAFLDAGHQAVGVELVQSRVDTANNFLEKYIQDNRVKIINKNIYDITENDLEFNSFDLVILKDVIEHIPHQEKFIRELKKFLTHDGIVFFAYPPWWMPFGGHQQVCRSKYLRLLPWIHLLPKIMYRSLLRFCKEPDEVVEELLELKKTGIIIEKMNRLVKCNGFIVLKEKYWLFNPIYKYKFKLKPRGVFPFFGRIPYVRNFYTTAHYLVFTIRM